MILTERTVLRELNILNIFLLVIAVYGRFFRIRKKGPGSETLILGSIFNSETKLNSKSAKKKKKIGETEPHIDHLQLTER